MEGRQHHDTGEPAGLGSLPNELMVHIIQRIGATDLLNAAGLYSVNSRMRAWCQVPLFDASLLPPTIQRNLDAPAADNDGPRKISVAEAVRARARRDAMRRRVLYALYSLYAFMGQAGQGCANVPALPFNPNKTESDWMALLFPALRGKRGDHAFGTVYITLPRMGVLLGKQFTDVKGECVIKPPHEQHYAAVDYVLTQALARAAVDTISEADTLAVVCAPIDIRRAFMDSAELPNGHFVRSAKAAVALNVVKIGHLWYPWADNRETFASTVKGEPVHVYNNGTLVCQCSCS